VDGAACDVALVALLRSGASRTHRSHERFNLRKWGPSWWCRRSADCTTATNDGLPEKARFHHATRFLPWAIGICVRTVLPCRRVHRRISFTRLRQGRKLLEAFGPVGGMTSLMGCTEFSVGTLHAMSKRGWYSGLLYQERSLFGLG